MIYFGYCMGYYFGFVFEWFLGDNEFMRFVVLGFKYDVMMVINDMMMVIGLSVSVGFIYIDEICNF